VDYIWINEIPEIREDDYDESMRRLRGGRAKYAQMICDFNPIGRMSWVYKRFFEQNFGNPRKLKYTIFDNHPNFLNSDKGRASIEILRRMKEKDPNQYKIYFLGEWGDLKGIIFSWDIQPLPTEDFNWYDEIWYGLDFGYSVDPAALVRIYRKAIEFWLEEVIYETGLTNQDLARRMHMKGVDPAAPIYCDSAEPKSIEEIRREGFNAKPASKGPDSVKAGIDYLKSLRIHIVDGSENISKEQKSHTWAKDKDGNDLNVPVDFNDHAMSASRYGIWTHMKDRTEARIW
jgi:phage terminase large subunit